jgi:ADP-ribosylglycohydrolase
MQRTSKGDTGGSRRPDLPGDVATWRQRFRGCLLGGAVGDALGAPVEFMSRAEILARYGERGIRSFDVAYGRAGAITDDTQMTMFTAEGLLQALSRRRSGIIEPPELVVHRAYLRWLATQRLADNADSSGADASGWLIGVPELHARRAPGNTCVGALASGRMGTPDEPLNNSKGCGGVMRAAPCALVKEWDPFELGCKVAAVTHGHPTGYLAAGALAVIVRGVLEGLDVTTGVIRAIKRLERELGHEECVQALMHVLHFFATHGRDADIEELGRGWVAEEALAMGVFGALAGEERLTSGLTLGYFARGVRIAANHSGDSDSTAAIAGNILGALYGEETAMELGVAGVELREEIVSLADDLLDAWLDEPGWRERYQPGPVRDSS